MNLGRYFFILLFIAGPIGAQESIPSDSELPVREKPAPFPKFQSKSVRPPSGGVKQESTVKVTRHKPNTDKAAEPPIATAGAAPKAAARFGAFWEEISPDLTGSGPGRLEPALRAAARQSDLTAPRLQALQDIAQVHGVPILLETVNTRISPALVLAVISVESAGQAEAVSTAGAQGLMQLMPDTATRFGVEDAFDPAQNVAGGVKYLDWLMEKFDGDPILVLAGYNAGAGAIRDHKGVPPYAETRDYVPKVLAAFKVARGLCKTPPQLISDGCVFHNLK